MSRANDSEGGRLRRRSDATGEKESLPLRHEFVARRWLLVARKKSLKHTMLGGFEANPVNLIFTSN